MTFAVTVQHREEEPDPELEREWNRPWSWV